MYFQHNDSRLDGLPSTILTIFNWPRFDIDSRCNLLHWKWVPCKWKPANQVGQKKNNYQTLLSLFPWACISQWKHHDRLSMSLTVIFYFLLQGNFGKPMLRMKLGFVCVCFFIVILFICLVAYLFSTDKWALGFISHFEQTLKIFRC